MWMTVPAEVGMSLDEVDTPSLVLDLDAFERNLARMAAAVPGPEVRLRPHAKSHKCPEIARRQVAHGAVGVCCQKVSEAEAMVRGGIDNVLVSNEVVGDRKLDRLAALAARAWVGVCADHPDNVAAIERAAARHAVTIDVLVEIDNGAGRCGIAPGAPAVGLARRVADSAHLRFGGLQAYQGSAQHVRSPAERRAAAARAAAITAETVAALDAAGLPCAIVGGGGTGTWQVEAGSGVYNEIQAGSYVFMDADYARNDGDNELPATMFEQSLFVLATVMSRPTPSRVVLDAGLKASATDSGQPLVHDLGRIPVERSSDEHGVFALPDGATVSLGQRLRLIPGHCDPTVNLHDWIVGIRKGVVECLWPVAARGLGY